MDEVYPNNKDTLLVDIGTGNSAIYLILAERMFGWKGYGIEKNQDYLESA